MFVVEDDGGSLTEPVGDCRDKRMAGGEEVGEVGPGEI